MQLGSRHWKDKKVDFVLEPSERNITLPGPGQLRLEDHPEFKVTLMISSDFIVISRSDWIDYLARPPS